MATTPRTLIDDALHLTREPDISYAGSQTTGGGSGFAGEVAGRDTDDFLFQKMLEFVTLLHTPSPFNCIYTEGQAVGSLDVATASASPGLIDLMTLSPFIWRPRIALVNGYPCLPMNPTTANLYCNLGAMDARGNPATFTQNGTAVQVLPVPPQPTGITTVRIEVRGGIVPTLPTLLEPAAQGGGLDATNSFSFLLDNELRYLIPRYLVACLSSRNADDPDLGSRGAEAMNDVARWILSRYQALDVQTRNTVFKTAPTPPIPHPGTLKTRRATEV